MPFIPVETMARAGLQPFASIATYKNTYASGDFAGLSTKTTFAPNFLMNFAYVMVEDENSGDNRGTEGGGRRRGITARLGGKPTRGNDFAIITSPEFQPWKGLDIKPLYSLFYAEGTTSASARRASVDRHFTDAKATAATPHHHELRVRVRQRGQRDQRLHGDARDPAHDRCSTRAGVSVRSASIRRSIFQWGSRDYLAWSGTSSGDRKPVDGKHVLLPVRRHR